MSPVDTVGLAPAGPTSQPAACDIAAALERMDGDVELLKMLAAIFLSECPQRMAEIRQAINQRDTSKLLHSAHTIRGSVANFGARDAVEAARRLEIDASAQDWDQAEKDWAALEKALGGLEPVLVQLSPAGAS